MRERSTKKKKNRKKKEKVKKWERSEKNRTLASTPPTNA